MVMIWIRPAPERPPDRWPSSSRVLIVYQNLESQSSRWRVHPAVSNFASPNERRVYRPLSHRPWLEDVISKNSAGGMAGYYRKLWKTRNPLLWSDLFFSCAPSPSRPQSSATVVLMDSCGHFHHLFLDGAVRGPPAHRPAWGLCATCDDGLAPAY